MNWSILIYILCSLGCALTILPFIAYILGKCVMFGILMGQKQFKEYEDGKSKKKE